MKFTCGVWIKLKYVHSWNANITSCFNVYNAVCHWTSDSVVIDVVSCIIAYLGFRSSKSIGPIIKLIPCGPVDSIIKVQKDRKGSVVIRSNN